MSYIYFYFTGKTALPKISKMQETQPLPHIHDHTDVGIIILAICFFYWNAFVRQIISPYKPGILI